MKKDYRMPESTMEMVLQILPEHGDCHCGGRETRSLQGVDFTVLDQGAAITWFDNCITVHKPVKVAIANAHTLNVARKDERLKKLLTRFVVFNDGIGVDLASRLRYGQGFPANLNGTDLIPAYLENTRRRLRIFMLGARPHVVRRAFAVAKQKYPRHDWVGFCDGYFNACDEEALCEWIRNAKADLLLVAMGNPLQELWIDRCAASCGATLNVGVGALFDFLSGEVRRAPAYLRRSKLEWCYRLFQEPGRMWQRYLIGNFSFLWHAWQERQ